MLNTPLPRSSRHYALRLAEKKLVCLRWASIGIFSVLLVGHDLATAQQPGTAAVVRLVLPLSVEPVQGWSVRRGLLGRPVYGAGQKHIGVVTDLVVTDAASPYVLIIANAGFLEIGGHAVAVPINDVTERNGLLILRDATRRSLKAMPGFPYSYRSMTRPQFIGDATARLNAANVRLTQLKKESASAVGSEHHKQTLANDKFQAEITVAEDKLADLKQAEASRWRALQPGVQAAIVRLGPMAPRDPVQPEANAVPADDVKPS